jgi:hypothetical protein
LPEVQGDDALGIVHGLGVGDNLPIVEDQPAEVAIAKVSSFWLKKIEIG